MPAAPPPEEAVEEDGPPKTEAEQLQWQIDNTTDEVGGSIKLYYFLINFFLSHLFSPSLPLLLSLLWLLDAVRWPSLECPLERALSVVGIYTAYETTMRRLKRSRYSNPRCSR